MCLTCAYLEEVPRHAHFKLGDYVVTSGYSAVFPPGVRVGKILHVFNSSAMVCRIGYKLALLPILPICVTCVSSTIRL